MAKEFINIYEAAAILNENRVDEFHRVDRWLYRSCRRLIRGALPKEASDYIYQLEETYQDSI